MLEGRDEVGGRSRSRRVDGDVIELGGQHISRHHHRMRRLVAEAGLHIQRDRYLPGPVNWRRPHDPAGRLIPRVTPREVLALRRLFLGSRNIWSISAVVRSQQRRDEVDALSVADWFDQLKLSGAVRHLVECFVADGGGGVDPRDISLLQFADFLTRESSIARFALTGMGLHGHITEGTGALCGYLADRIGPRLRLSTMVTAVDQDDRGVAVHTHDGDTVHGDYLILAIPTPVLGDIRFTPEVPEPIRSANANVRYGQGTKVAAVVSARRPQQAKGFIGGTIVRAGWRTDRVLYGFASTTRDEPSSAVLIEDLCRAFGVDPDAVQRIELMAWSHDPFTRGTYVYLPPGRYACFRRSLPQNYQRVRFAGAERSSWPTWMEGAVESGEDAANAIIA
ncbi:flavin containing amine oxidoreductase family protein [Mycobacterium sp. MAC_080597_8934]|nr:flavin containing amine oxidoreductase family protein [Mycobacterium sp. MAC_080597_8934]